LCIRCNVFTESLLSNGHGATHIENTYRNMFYCCVRVLWPLCSNGSTLLLAAFVARLFTESLSSNGYMRHNIIHHLRLGLFLSGFPTNILYSFLFYPFMLHALPRQMNKLIILIYLIIQIIRYEEYKLCSSALCCFLQPPVTSSLLCPNILLGTLFSNTHSLCSSLNVRHQDSHPYTTTYKIIQGLLLVT
jgi:hypothetical protein